MNKFLKTLKLPVVVGAIAAVLFCISSLLTQHVLTDPSYTRGFLWVAFVGWTLTFTMNKNIDRVKMLASNIVGFFLAIAMIQFGSLFGGNILGIGIASFIGMFILNGLATYVGGIQKYLNGSGVFMGLFLTFSGLGVGLAPDTIENGSILLGIMLLYAVLGYVAAAATNLLMKHWKSKEGIKTKAKKTTKKEVPEPVFVEETPSKM